MNHSSIASLSGRPKVNVLGATVAGLTVAHTLCARGFDVCVVESAADEKGRGLALGGPNGTRWCNAQVAGIAPAASDTALSWFDQPVVLKKRTNGRWPTPKALKDLMATRLAEVGAGGKDQLAFDAIGSAAGLTHFKANAGLTAHLHNEIVDPTLGDDEVRLVLLQASVPREPAAPRFFSRDANLDQVLGEIPWRHGSAHDALRPVRSHEVDGKGAIPAPHTGPLAGQLRSGLRSLVSTLGGIDERDVRLLQFVLLRFLSSGEARRWADYAGVSWTELLVDTWDGRPVPSEFLHLVSTWWGAHANADAYTACVVLCRVLEGACNAASSVERTAADTADTWWFEPWRAHLQAAGVRFVQASPLQLDAAVSTQTLTIPCSPVPTAVQADPSAGGQTVRLVFGTAQTTAPTGDFIAVQTARDTEWLAIVDHRITAAHADAAGFRVDAVTTRANGWLNAAPPAADFWVCALSLDDANALAANGTSLDGVDLLASNGHAWLAEVHEAFAFPQAGWDRKTVTASGAHSTALNRTHDAGQRVVAFAGSASTRTIAPSLAPDASTGRHHKVVTNHVVSVTNAIVPPHNQMWGRPHIRDGQHPGVGPILEGTWTTCGDYVMTSVRGQCPEAAVESGRRAANLLLQAARANTSSSWKVGPDVPVVDSQASEPWGLDDLKQLDDALVDQGMGHVFDLLQVRDRLVVFEDALAVARRAALLDTTPAQVNAARAQAGQALSNLNAADLERLLLADWNLVDPQTAQLVQSFGVGRSIDAVTGWLKAQGLLP